MLATNGTGCEPLSPGREALGSGRQGRGRIATQPQQSLWTGAGGTGASGGREPREHIGPEHGVGPPAGDDGGWCMSCGTMGRAALGTMGAEGVED
jgi:hypothetical protein